MENVFSMSIQALFKLGKHLHIIIYCELYWSKGPIINYFFDKYKPSFFDI